ncbi:MAG: 23S rRNA (adenine(2030)-N(6))-methyltransferase RlmJ [Alphaproteobacteria bacterium]
MNYRHAFHAGSAADVFKHAVLTLLLLALRAKDRPFAVLDTHAGLGRYDLTAAEARKTGEFRRGIARLLAAPAPPAPVEPYLDIVRAANDGGPDLAVYPGSPAITQALLRPDDRLMLVDLHPAAVAALRAAFRGDRRVSIHRRAGYEALAALLPPVPRRGLVVVDPPFEVADEFARMVAGVVAAARRWPTGLYALWYPIKLRGAIDGFHGELAMTGLRRQLVVELTARGGPPGLIGSGMVLVNPPWRLADRLAELLPALGAILYGEGAACRVDWLVGE